MPPGWQGGSQHGQLQCISDLCRIIIISYRMMKNVARAGPGGSSAVLAQVPHVHAFPRVSVMQLRVRTRDVHVTSIKSSGRGCIYLCAQC